MEVDLDLFEINFLRTNTDWNFLRWKYWFLSGNVDSFQ